MSCERQNVMKKLLLVIGLAAALTGCSQQESAATSNANSAGAVPTSGASAAASPAASTPAASEPGAPSATPAEKAAPAATPADEDKKPAYRDVTIPAGTTLPLTLRTAVGSATSNVEDQVRATLRTPVTVKGVRALPEGTTFIGHVTDAARSGKVKGRARIAFRFTRADPPGDGEQLTVRTGTVSRLAPATKKRDAATIGGGAVGGAIVGGIIGGGDGAAKGAAIGGAGGTGVVLATRGKEVSLPSGTAVSVKLTAPLTVRVAVK
jgi:hypothetical protein